MDVVRLFRWQHASAFFFLSPPPFFSILATAYNILRLSVVKHNEMGRKRISHSVILIHSLDLADIKVFLKAFALFP